ncbi:MAG: D-2-hydroxyacid dehydrogenase [Erysipelotrichaceae bacterium]|nr:D-2-hydroxyacid dehydrogenase [Erysipelotrichaceae bacterium]MDY5251640.1 D-2-hydroxyacid dehydrogenase [Erysipelotrichaceae bacterium]
MVKVLIITSDITGIIQKDSEALKQMMERFAECTFKVVAKGEETQEDILWADVITGHPYRKLLKQANGLQWLHLQSAGVNGYEDLELYGNKNILLTRSADVFSVAMAEHALGMLLALNRLLPFFIRQSLDHNWQRIHARYELSGSTVLLLGCGSIAKEIAKRLKGFDCKVLGIKRDVTKPIEHFDQLYTNAQKDEAIAKADYIINTLPLTDSTFHYLSAHEFALMKQRTIFINVGRGKTVDTIALIEALQNKQIMGAGLDVFENEPLEVDSLLWEMDNVIITPHGSGDSLQSEIRRLKLFEQQLSKFIKGEKLEFVVNFKKGY